jgi:hypothetical protein
LSDTSQKYSFRTQLHNFTRTKAADNQQNQPKTFQGHVSKILENDFIEFTLDAIGPYTLPKLTIPQAFSKYHREPTKVGDKGYAVPGDFAIGGTDGAGTGTANMYPRSNLATHVFHPISIKSFDVRDPDMFLVTGGKSGHTIQSEDKSTSTIIDQLNNIIHKASAAIQHTAIGNILHTAGEILSHNGKTINQIAASSMVHAVTSGTLMHLAQTITMAQPSTTAFELYDVDNPPTTPTPGGATLLNVIGSIAASVSISAAGGMTSGGQPVMTAPVPPQLINAPINVIGSRGGNPALASLLTALATLGLITDSTVP